MEAKAKTRNICILAHVDHGKTTLADHLIAGAGGGVIHPKQAGKLRYLDYRDDEQQRAITMKSASICLRFRGEIINLIDSPGHVDFCSEVSTAVRLSDGALVLVDVCEGVHIQTHAVLRQAWMEHVKPCLVLNKVDRLITELKLTPMEAYTRMQGIISEVNNIISGLRSEKYLSDVDSILAGGAEKKNDPEASGSEDGDLDNQDDENDEFVPQRGNVAFCSAMDGWAFRTDQFAELYATKLGASAVVLKKALWGDYYYHPKTKKIVGKKTAAGKLKPMFVQCILEPLWQVYNAVMEGKDGADMLSKVIKSLHLTIPSRELQNRDPKMVLQAVMSRWLPLPDGVLSMVLEVLPEPASAQPVRMARLFPKRLISADTTQEVQAEIETVRKAVEACDDGPEAPCVVFVSKMFAVPVEMLPRENSTNTADFNVGDTDASTRECFLAFTRVFSGVLSVGQQLFVVSALYDPTESQPEKRHLQVATVESLYMMMGRGLDPCDRVPAGNVVAIRGLGQYILKSATLSSTQYCWPFASLSFQAAPIVRVAVEPSDPANIGALSRGLKLLNRADPFVEVSLSPTGEHVISAAGEVHLELCIKDLKERFACVELEVSPPLVAFKETIEAENGEPVDNHKNHYIEATTPNGRCTIRVHVSRMPTAVIQVLDESTETLKSVTSGKKKVHGSEEGKSDPISILNARLLAAAESTSNESEAEKRRTKDFKNKLKQIWTLGPRQVGPNILMVPDYNSSSKPSKDAAEVRGFPYLSELLGFPVERTQQAAALSNLEQEAQSLEGSIVSGFQLATAAGPLCEEPMWGLVFTVEAYVTASSNDNLETADRYGPFSGQVLTVVKEACRSAMFSKKPRLVEAMYLCEVNTTSQYLGQMYGVLARRRARVLKEEMREGTAMFTVHAFVPVAESFGFAEELRRKTSGAASAQLMLSHWEPLTEDPFFVPKTEEELEEFGDGSSVPQNTARKLIDAVRRRKGLPVEEKVVRHATKQRTLARKV